MANTFITQESIAPAAIKQRHLVPSPTQKGDIYYGKDGNSFANLPIGRSNQYLTVTGGVPAWQTGTTGPSGPMFTTFPTIESYTSTATPAPQAQTNVYELSAQTQTASFQPQSGTPYNGQPLHILITSSNTATARPLVWSSATGGYAGAGLPSATATGASTMLDFIYMSTNAPAKYRLLAVATAA